VNYCSQCGNPVIEKIPAGDNRERFVCLGCGIVHYSNPNIITGCLVTHDDSVLLCQRSISPQKGLWTLPAGFMENNETVAEGAIRETLEETRANVSIEGIYSLYDIPHISQLYIFHRAELVSHSFEPGEETSDVRLFRESEIPWDELAFSIIGDTLRHYFSDRHSKKFPVRTKTCFDRL
jgi:ADP-ribose pyrophosphatase YjhB (NUDIX family)